VLRSSALIALLLSARALVAADPSLTEYVPPDTKILIGVQVRAMVDSDWGKTLIEQVNASGGAWMKEMPFTGFDPLKDLDEVWIACTSADGKSPSLAILRGRFDTSRLPAAIGRYHQVPLIPLDAKRQQLLAIVDSSIVLAGDRNSVELAIDRHGSKMAPDASLLAAAAELRARYWIWAKADHLTGLSTPQGAPQGIEAVEGLEFGLALNHDLEMAVQLHMRTAADAEKLLGTMALLQMMAKNQQKDASQAKIESRVTGKNLDVSLRVPESELKQAWEQQRAMIAQSLSQLPQQIAAARSGSFNPFAPSRQGPAPLPVPAPHKSARHIPVSKEGKIVSDGDGATVQLTLPGSR
jgi:hypothetical protein